MKGFPLGVILAAGANLLPALLIPFYLFGGLHPFGISHSDFINFLLFLLTNLLWVIPVFLFFRSLSFYDRGYKKLGMAIAVLGWFVTIAAIWVVVENFTAK